MYETCPVTAELLRSAEGGDPAAVDALFAHHRPRLRAMVALRMDRRLTSRLDPSDVVQDATTLASQRLGEYFARSDLPFYPWLRQFAWDRLIQLHRMHVLAQKRSVEREAAIYPSDASICLLADQLVGRESSPSRQAERRETQEAVREALKFLSDLDQEVVLLRHVEHLPVSDIAAMWKVTQAAVRSRYRRALERLHHELTDPGGGRPS